jgi:hypothetical protein
MSIELVMNDPTTLAKLVRCPEDGGLLDVADHALINPRLGIEYPVCNGVPDLRRASERQD